MLLLAPSSFLLVALLLLLLVSLVLSVQREVFTVGVRSEVALGLVLVMAAATRGVLLPRLHVVLVQPRIHWNTGNVGRTCLGFGASLVCTGVFKE
jgi:hypothetical protein